MVLVGDVICAASLATGFSTGSTGLNIEFFTASLELVNRFLGPSGEINVDGSTHASSKVGGAGVDKSILFREGKVLSTLSLDRVSNSLDSTGKTREYTLDIASLLHGDNSHLVLFIDPEQEGLGGIVEDSTTLWPVTLHTSNSKVAVSANKEEVVINKLLADSFIHAGKGIVVASKIIGELAKSTAHQLLNINTLLLGDSGGETESINAASNTDTGGVNWDSLIDVSSDLGGIQDLREILVAIPVTSIDTTMLVVKLDSAGTGLGDGEAAGLGLNVLDAVPSLLGHMLGHQGVRRLNNGEFSRHVYR